MASPWLFFFEISWMIRLRNDGQCWMFEGLKESIEVDSSTMELCSGYAQGPHLFPNSQTPLILKKNTSIYAHCHDPSEFLHVYMKLLAEPLVVLQYYFSHVILPSSSSSSSSLLITLVHSLVSFIHSFIHCMPTKVKEKVRKDLLIVMPILHACWEQKPLPIIFWKRKRAS